MRFKTVKAKDITPSFLHGFIRTQETNRVKYIENNILKEKEDNFFDRWDDQKLESISNYLHDVVSENRGTVVVCIDKDRVVGFTNIESPVFKEYINLPYIHVSKDYRGQGIGKELLYLIGGEAKKLGAKKLYISAHPAIETQAFYDHAGCTLAKYINQELLAIEPYDIQMEFDLDSANLYLRYAKHLMKKDYVSSTEGGKIANYLFRKLPESELRFLKICRAFMNQNNISLYSIATNWFKKRSDCIAMRNFKYFEDVLFNYVDGWGEVDQLCYRALNPLIELREENYEYLLKWSDSKNKDVRRASLVSMIRSSGKLTLEYDYEKMIFLVDKLKNDEDFHVRKAVGWVLKCAYPTYPEKVNEYLNTHHETLDRMIFRYALEHASKSEKTELMNLE